MPPDLNQLDLLKSRDLRDCAVDVNWHQDRRHYTLTELLAEQGQTSITWKALDSFERSFAIKFVLRADYATHSLDAEMSRANSLKSRLFAKVDYFGEPAFPAKQCIACNDFYAIVVEWIAGQTLKEYLHDPKTEVSPELFCQLARDLCEPIQALKEKSLAHNDLHERNILVHPIRDALRRDETVELIVIDTGQLKMEERRSELLDLWGQKVSTLEDANRESPGSVNTTLKRYKGLVEYFSRTDQEWIVCHLCNLYNCMQRSLPNCDAVAKRFIRQLPNSLKSMVDPDPSRRLDDPGRMYDEITRLWDACRQPAGQGKGMTSPFDLPSAELILSDRQLMALFSEEYPGLDVCRNNAPTYLYGPRGCGKSTILRSLSLKAVLASQQPSEEIKKVQFVGVYLSSSQELRSRFWLMRDEDFDALEGHVIRYFSLLLIEALVDTLNRMFQWDMQGASDLQFGMTEDVAAKCADAIRSRVGLDADEVRYARTSCLVALEQQLRRTRDDLWLKILDRNASSLRPDAQLIFDVCRDLKEACTFLRDYRTCFLIDDYSNQRIPVALQKRLNQAITFSKQGSPIFKVTSEYDGVDLEGIQEGREVNEVNVGFEYVSFENKPLRHRFLSNVLQRRFKYLDKDIDLLEFLPLSELKPAIPLARAIREAFKAKKRFHYHGLDTISDLCSGDFAMGIDLVRRIFEHAGVSWDTKPQSIAPRFQDDAIREYTKQEFEYIQYHSRDGRKKYEIADQLCWLSKQCVVCKDTEKEGKIVPVVKNHLDITETALRDLERQYADSARLLRDLVSRGVLFPLQTSRSRQGHQTTRRLMIRRILLTQHTAALGRDQPIRIDDVQRLQYFLTEPSEFVKAELKRTSATQTAKPDPQPRLFPEEPEDEDADA